MSGLAPEVLCGAVDYAFAESDDTTAMTSGRWKASSFRAMSSLTAHRMAVPLDASRSKRGKANEPNPLRSPEASQVLAKVFRALREQAEL
jgi:hypothetical protein